MVQYIQELWEKNWFGKALAIVLSLSTIVFMLQLVLVSIFFLVKLVDYLPEGTISSKIELDILYDVSSMLLPVITIIAIIVALDQVKVAEKTSKGASYIYLFDTAARAFDELLQMTEEIKEDYRDYVNNTKDVPPKSEGEYISELIYGWDTDYPPNIVLRDFLLILENIGLLVRKDYVSKDDVYLAFEGPLKSVSKTYGVYIQNVKDGSKPFPDAPDEDGKLLEHTHWLLVTIEKHKLRNPLQKVQGRLV